MFTCITNDCEAKEKTHNCENLQKMCVKTLLVTLTILSSNLLLNDFCFKIIVDTRDEYIDKHVYVHFVPI